MAEDKKKPWIAETGRMSFRLLSCALLDGAAKLCHYGTMYNPADLAILHYTMSDFEVVAPGSYVLCAVTGRPILLEDLLYWSAEYQEAYADAEAATRAKLAGGAVKLRQAG